MIYRYFITLIFLISLTSCATEKKYKAHLDTFIGQDKKEVLKRLGPPVARYTIDNSEWWHYRKTDFDLMWVGNGNHGNPQYIPVEQSCITQFEIVENKVKYYRFEGGICVMK
jgi:hypothetical protein